MSLTNVYKSLLPHVRTYSVQRSTTVHNQGEVEETLTALTLRAAILPISARVLQTLPAGEYTSQDVNAYELGGELTLARRDQIAYRGASYFVNDVKDWRDEGNFVRYLCKKGDSAA
jgi:hypothetical protein